MCCRTDWQVGFCHSGYCADSRGRLRLAAAWAIDAARPIVTGNGSKARACLQRGGGELEAEIGGRGPVHRFCEVDGRD